MSRGGSGGSNAVADVPPPLLLLLLLLLADGSPGLAKLQQQPFRGRKYDAEPPGRLRGALGVRVGGGGKDEQGNQHRSKKEGRATQNEKC